MMRLVVALADTEALMLACYMRARTDRQGDDHPGLTAVGAGLILAGLLRQPADLGQARRAGAAAQPVRYLPRADPQLRAWPDRAADRGVAGDVRRRPLQPLYVTRFAFLTGRATGSAPTRLMPRWPRRRCAGCLWWSPAAPRDPATPADDPAPW
jgi:hypothetical protein